MSVLDELHDIITDLEGEGHQLAGRFRDFYDRVKHEVGDLLDGGKSELEQFLGGLVSTLRPELDKLKADIVAEVVAELGKVTGAVQDVVHEVQVVVGGKAVSESTVAEVAGRVAEQAGRDGRAARR